LMWTYQGGDPAEGMEKYLFKCPVCGAYDMMWAKGEEFGCTACGMKGRIDEHGFLVSTDDRHLPFDNTYDWTRWMEKEFDSYVESMGDQLLFTEKDATLFVKDDNYEDRDLQTCDIQLYGDRMVMGDMEFRFADITGLTIIYSDEMFFTHQGTYYGMRGDLFHAWKCARLWQLAQGIADDPTKEI
ncbi:MAG: hypothetical protein IKX81_05340, partial [Firmicutes bacterium]|nr:hypothetical protein [Bacillota bacterium]